MDRTEKLWVGSIVASIGDVLTTWYGITVLGITEKNPIMAHLFAEFGPMVSMLVTKTVALGFLYVLAGHLLNDQFEWFVPAYLTVFFGIVTAGNLIAILLAI